MGFHSSLLLPFLWFAYQVIVSFRVNGNLSSCSFFLPKALPIRPSNTHVKKALPSLKKSVSLPKERITKVYCNNDYLLPSEWKEVMNHSKPCLSYSLSLSTTLPPDSFTVVLTEDGKYISKKFNNTLLLLRLYKKVYRIHSVVFSDSPCIIKYAKQLGFSVLPVTKRNKFGLPVLKWLLITARDSFPSRQIIFINSDILINPFVFEVSHRLHAQFNGSNYLLASNVYNTRDVPRLDFSSVSRYMASIRSVKSQLRSPRAIDLFVFSRSFPFRSLHDVVVGRYWVDNEILVYCHLSHKTVVDLSNLKSYHQGTIHSGSKREAISAPDFNYNSGLLVTQNLTTISLSSTYYTV